MTVAPMTLDAFETTARTKIDSFLANNRECSDYTRMVAAIFRAHHTLVFTPRQLAKIAEGLFGLYEVDADKIEAGAKELQRARVLRRHMSGSRDVYRYEVTL